MPNKHYLPDLGRIKKQSTTNKQGSADAIEHTKAAEIVSELARQQQDVYGVYEAWVGNGIAKEIARLNTPVSRYSKMRAKTDVRNWLAFLALRMETSAQWEIRQYANAVASIVSKLFPRTFELFLEHDLMATRLSRSEMKFLNYLFSTVLGDDDSKRMLSDRAHTFGMEKKRMESLIRKLTTNKEEIYKGALKP